MVQPIENHILLYMLHAACGESHSPKTHIRGVLSIQRDMKRAYKYKVNYHVLLHFLSGKLKWPLSSIAVIPSWPTTTMHFHRDLTRATMDSPGSFEDLTKSGHLPCNPQVRQQSKGTSSLASGRLQRCTAHGRAADWKNA